jgi:hypothetical protein
MNPQQQMRLLRKNLEMLSLACANDLQYLMMATTNGELAEKKGNNNADLIQEIYKLCGMLLERIQHVCKAIVQVRWRFLALRSRTKRVFAGGGNVWLRNDIPHTPS